MKEGHTVPKVRGTLTLLSRRFWLCLPSLQCYAEVSFDEFVLAMLNDK
ncbi:MAG: hypothetical protein OFPII_00650 [Osedax symbiont Rs1]|nr:MAG: hypothetical protein OFPII_00650 [Osedax symbiont Rs1]